MGRKPKNAPTESAPAEVAPEPAAAEVVQHEPEEAQPEPKPVDPDFVKGGRFYYEDNPRCKGRGLEYVDAVYVDSDGEEYPAKLIPLPITKGTIAEVPAVFDFQKELELISRMPKGQQLQASRELNERASANRKAFLIRGQSIPLMDYKGHLLKTYEKQVGDGNSAHTREVPCADLLVNFSRDPMQTRWTTVENAVPEGHVSTPPAGEKLIPHFKLS